MRLVGNDGQAQFQNRAHFFGAAAEAMRRIDVAADLRSGRAAEGVLVQAGTGALDRTPELRVGKEKGRRGRIYQLITITDFTVH